MPPKNSQNIPPAGQPQPVAQPKKDSQLTKPSSYELKQTVVVPKGDQPPAQKKLPRRSSKPIINWFQRKLAGTVRTRRASDGESSRIPQQRHPTRRPSIKTGPRKHAVSPGPGSKPLNIPNREAISLNEDDGYSSAPDTRDYSDDEGESSINRSSIARESTWSPLEADDNASLRPLPPSAPPSPSPSRSSSSYLSNPHTFRSMTASTKPTTVLSMDLNGGVAHIAQAPVTPVNPGWFSPHVRTSSTGTSTGPGGGGSITFSALPPSPQSSSRPSSLQNNASALASANNLRPVQAPQHTAHHPRNNPRPSSPPSDNASVLTLASSAFGFPTARIGINALSYNSERSVRGAGDSISHISASHFLLGDEDRMYNDGEMERDVDASVRALRPRSSRRGSWESEASGWSADVGGTYSLMGPGTPIGTRERSLWTANSVRTGDIDEDIDEASSEGEGNITQETLDPSKKVAEASKEEDTPTPEFTPSEEKPEEKHERRATDATVRPSFIPTTEAFVLADVEKTPKYDKQQVPDEIEHEEKVDLRPTLGDQQPSDISGVESFYSAASTPLP